MFYFYFYFYLVSFLIPSAILHLAAGVLTSLVRPLINERVELNLLIEDIRYKKAGFDVLLHVPKTLTHAPHCLAAPRTKPSMQREKLNATSAAKFFLT